ncbi:redox protein, regulator of disulfide bond formation [Secundilactobacillus oryzae JCM 18671]|uniref:Redox protein, regulator of disulfide bond formation n=1 Tax=Secundilactobacillus oryzae JCM 18671 TaxID=1291743 RepID=A0A081BKR5_9LACO|nr:OsmC family protein [Secundilactobacillus oryzae]GAK48633.1 redox protein, regulator of disulfide bond formation [Secundilactobacillus oryzae JCM 18671]
MEPKKLYETNVINTDGVNGHVFVEGDGELDVAISDPRNDEAGANPEQFIGLALSTCLNATIEAVEKREHQPHTSQVHVHVTLIKGEHGLEFLVHAKVYIPGVDFETAKTYTAIAEKRCPVSKLLQGSANVKIETVETL